MLPLQTTRDPDILRDLPCRRNIRVHLRVVVTTRLYFHPDVLDSIKMIFIFLDSKFMYFNFMEEMEDFYSSFFWKVEALG